ncbi:MAG: peptidylprolyl isomerase [Clostridia bacterium]|nr:peptidylprolyl isomerase [Clostridia bacterium]
MADNNQNKAEVYRQERKERLAKAAKKNAKNIEKKTAARSAVKKVVAIVLIAAIALGCVAGILNYCGIFHRALQIGYVGDENISYSEYTYYYYKVYNQIYSTAKQYSQYGMDYGYDTSLTPAEQTKTTKDEDGNDITWLEYIHNQTVDVAQMYLAYYQEAKKKGLKLDDADLATIKSTIEDMREQADSAGKSGDEDTNAGLSLNAYLRRMYGNGISEGFYKKQLKVETLVQKYYNTMLDEYAETFTAEEVDKKYNEDKDSYLFVDARVYQFKNEELTAEDGESDDELKARQAKSDETTKANAKAMYDAITNEASFITEAKKYNTAADYDADAETMLKSYPKSDSSGGSSLSSLNSDLADWAFNDSTKAGDKKLVEDSENGAYYVALLVTPKHDVETVSVRHILFKTTDDDNKPLDDEKIKAAKKNAEDALEKFKSGEQTAEKFGEYAANLTEDTGSKSTGGLYENVRPGQMVTEFNDWIFDESRKEGDVDIVETSYGYHVMYFVGKDGSYKDNTIRKSLASEKFETFSKSLLEDEEYEVGLGPRRLKMANEQIEKRIARLVASENASSANTASAS